MYDKKQHIFICLVTAVFIGLFLFPAIVYAGFSRMTVESDAGALSETLNISITVNNPDEVAGAAFTLSYPKELAISVNSDFFTNIAQNFTSDTSLMVAAIRGNTNYEAASNTIMNLQVRLKDGSPGGTYEIAIEPTKISSPEFGYSQAGEEIDLLTSHDPCPLLSVLDYESGAVVNGAVFFDADMKTPEPGAMPLNQGILLLLLS
jgi:hypothetical protein